MRYQEFLDLHLVMATTDPASEMTQAERNFFDTMCGNAVVGRSLYTKPVATLRGPGRPKKRK